MGRLVDVDDLIERIEDVLSREQHKQAEVPSWLQKIIDNLPTAYDLENVINQLEERKEVWMHEEYDYGEGKYYAFQESIDIVRKNGTSN